MARHQQRQEFGAWFGVEFDAPFTAGKHLVGRCVPTRVDAEVAKMQKPYEGAQFEVTVDRVEAQSLFSFRWHPFAVEPNVDYSKEPTTIVVFELEDAPGGTMLTVTSRASTASPSIAAPAQCLQANDGGWTARMKLIAKYLAEPPEATAGA